MLLASDRLPAELESLATRGIRIFPVRPHSKLPLITKWQIRATHDIAAITEWSRQYPGCNWGAATGKRSGIFVLDVDGPPGFASLDTLLEGRSALPSTLSVNTSRGKHFYFRVERGLTIPTRVGFPAGGLDTRGEGGYAVVPPSTHESGHGYSFVDPAATIAASPSWLLELLGSDVKDVAFVYKGNRNSQLTQIAGKLRRRGLSDQEARAALIATDQKRCVPPLGPAEVNLIVSSVSRYSNNAPDVLARAWAAIEAEPYPSTYERFLMLCRQLYRLCAGRPIALPVQRIALHFGCDWSLIRRYRQKAVARGVLRAVDPYLYKKKAATFEVLE